MSSTAQSVEFQSVVKQLPTAIRRKNFSILVHRILGIAAYNGYDVNGYFPVTQKALKGCDSNYHLSLPFLEQLFDINHSYKAADGNGFCKAYRFKEKVTFSTFDFIDTEPNKEAICFDFEPKTVEQVLSVLKRLTVVTGKEKGSRAVKTPFQANHYFRLSIGQVITPQYVANRINLDREKCTYVVKNNVVTVTGEYKKTLLENVLTDKVNFAQISAGFLFNAIRQGQFFCSVSPTNGRVNDSFAALPSVLTPFLRLDSEVLKGLDIRNSQFLFFAVLLKNCVSEGKMFKFLKRGGYMAEIIGKKPYLFTLGELMGTMQQIVSKTKKGDDFNAFITQCEKGTVYDDFAEAAKLVPLEATEDEKKQARDKAKAAFFHLLFGAGGQTEYSKLFEQIYPSVTKIVKCFKRASNYKNFSIMLQKIESIYFVKLIRPAMIAAGVTVLTKHDSIFSKASQFKALERIFKDLFRKYFNDEFTTKAE
jgi:L-rhamnose mutarotase